MRSKVRLGLALGVSTLAVTAFRPAVAATVPGWADLLFAPSVSQTITISYVGDVAIFGATASGTSATAIVDSIDSGELVQGGVATGTGAAATVNLGIINAGNTTIHAVASAADVSATASALAVVSAGLVQYGRGDGGAALSLTNSGGLSIIADAKAAATNAPAYATAVVTGGLIQSAFSVPSEGKGGPVSATLDNSGDLTVAATAKANGALSAGAVANVNTGVLQIVGGTGSGSVALTNSGDLSIGAQASATATTAVSPTITPAIGVAAGARASVTDGFIQDAEVDGASSATVTNSGTLSVSSVAKAHAPVGGAYATASMSDGFVQNAFANVSGDAAVTLSNTGTLAIDALAQADGFLARATGVIFTAVEDHAYAADGNAAIALTNSGDFSITAQGSATGSAQAIGVGAVIGGMVQYAQSANGNASVSIDNSGTFSVAAIGNASAGGFATGFAQLASGLFQTAQAYGAGGAASAALTNSKTLKIESLANASASYVAYATALGTNMMNQFADATAGAATATLTNSGSLGLTVSAKANASTAALALAHMSGGLIQIAGAHGGKASATLTNAAGADLSVLASASATAGYYAKAHAELSSGIFQTANADAGTAVATIDNSGTLTVAGVATAHVTAASATRALAEVNMFGAIRQRAVGNSADASAITTNSGTLSVLADAKATGGRSASAVAFLTGGLYQRGLVVDGNLAEEISNSGTLTIGVNAEASGEFDVHALAVLQEGIWQRAQVTSGDASIDLTNSGTLTIASVASGKAVGTADSPNAISYATAVVTSGGYAANGEAYTGNIAETIENSGTINVMAMATSVAPRAALADAVIYGAVAQRAFASSGNATVTATNSGNLNIGLKAVATAGEAGTHSDAETYLYGGLYQQADTVAGNASVSLTNSGNIAVMASATANGGITGWARDRVYGAIGQQASASTGDASVSLNNSGTITVQAVANATAVDPQALAQVRDAVGQGAYASSGDASVSLANTGTIKSVLVSNAVSVDKGSAIADAYLNYAIDQYASASGGNAAVSLTNGPKTDGTGGLISLGLAATVSGGVYDHAAAVIGTGIIQDAWSLDGTASNTLTNNGTISMLADAKATAVSATYTTESSGTYTVGHAGAHGSVVDGIVQVAQGGAASNVLTNSGTIALAGQAQATAPVYAHATAYIRDGIVQSTPRSGTGANTLTNSGTVDMRALATANGGASANAYADQASAIYQAADAYFELDKVPTGQSNTLTNSGTIYLASAANAAATSASGSAYAQARINDGILQHAYLDYASADLATVNTITNSGTVTIGATATAKAPSSATAYANVTGVLQDGSAYTPVPSTSATATFTDKVTNTFTNAAAGKVNVVAVATANGDFADASAQAVGVSQVGNGNVAADRVSTTVVNSFTNSGAMTVAASAQANGVAGGSAFASALGIIQHGNGAATANVTNTGTMTVTAMAKAAGTSSYASAFALGAGADGVNSSSLTMNFANSGTLNVMAQATGATSAYADAIGVEATSFGANTLNLAGTITNSGTLSVTAKATGEAARADAVGVLLKAAANSVTLTNTGTIIVSAITPKAGGTVDAYGIVATATTAGSASPGAVEAGTKMVINNNGGTIIARQSTDDGATWKHGVAIDTRNAPDPVINLTGNGSIYGNINIAAADVINVSAGVTKFDGIVNDDGAMIGTLNILSGGTLYLQDKPFANTAFDGPAVVNVNTFTAASGSTVMVDLPMTPSGPLAAPQINANTATITGANLVVVPFTANGLYSNAYTVPNILTSTTPITGNFTTVDDVYNSPLLTVTQTRSADGTSIGVTVDRVAFGAVAGLGVNQRSVGNAIEGIYSPTLSTPFAPLVASLFTLNDAAYRSALSQLSGSQYASFMQSGYGSGRRFNGLLEEAGLCAAATDLRQTCRKESAGRIWGLFNYDSLKHDGDQEAPGYKSEQYNITLGTDVTIGEGWVIGIGGGYFHNKTGFDRYNGQIKADGFQIGGYSGVDMGSFYVRGAFSYTSIAGNSTRSIDAGAAVGTISAKPEMHVFSTHGELGFRAAMGNSMFTPHLGIDATQATLSSFNEHGVALANLDVQGGKINRVASEAGLRWEGKFGSISPDLDATWRHQFGRRNMVFGANFDLAPGSDFTVISQTEARDSAMVKFGLAGTLGKGVQLRVGYNGQFAKDMHSHGGNISLIVPLGGK